MICISTRAKAPAVSLKEAVLAGIAPDGGLYVPARIERRSDAWWSALRGKSFQDVAIAMAGELAGDEFGEATVEALVRDALNFPVRVVELEKGLGVVELFHGPTFAFKDFGARTLARLVDRLKDRAKPLTILVATSGDTGAAVAAALAETDAWLAKHLSGRAPRATRARARSASGEHPENGTRGGGAPRATK